ncbi:MAG TPA: hypothetical protein VF503_27450 [Sphingobium sp.]|uniref:hypothetical protein n=1 Tax=Sphingobium sp. TaxID=1912891 RepID=UPI002ED0C1B4
MILPIAPIPNWQQMQPVQPIALPAIAPVAATSSAGSSADSSTDNARSGSGSGAVYIPQRQDDLPPLYDKPSVLDASASAPVPAAHGSAHLHPFTNGETAYQDSATLAAPPASGAKVAKNLAEIAASAAYAMVADAGTMPVSVLAPLRGG